VASGDGAAVAGDEEPDEVPAERPAPAAKPAGAPVEPEALAQISVELRQQACDACFAKGAWRADPAQVGMPAPGVAAEDSSPVPHAAVAAAALAVVLRGALWVETEPRRQQRFLS